MTRVVNILLTVTAFVAALATIVAAALNIVDYAMNKPEVVEKTLAPFREFFDAYVFGPIALLLTTAVESPFIREVIAQLIASTLISLLAFGLQYSLRPRVVRSTDAEE